LAIYAAPRLVLAQTAPAGPSAAPSEDNLQAATAYPATAEAPAAQTKSESGESTDAEPSTSPAIAPGPKTKPHNHSPDMAGPAEITTPAIPRRPAAVVVGPLAGHPPYVVAVPRAPEPPHAGPKAPDAVEGKDSNASLEERLRRLEKMVESLTKNQERKESADVFLWKSRPGQQAWIDQGKLKDIYDSAQREAARAAEDANRATSEAEKAMKSQQDRAHGKTRDDLGQQIQSLERQRAALERAVERLQSQIERLEQQREKLEKDHEKLQQEQQRRSELLEKNSDENGGMALLEHPQLAQPGALVLPR
jgi:hypothetical protein